MRYFTEIIFCDGNMINNNMDEVKLLMDEELLPGDTVDMALA
jgi:hypothetical protein